ncbi:hypothetical protein [Paludisphaera soli]|uniref:hypothetical protein n=1 Tax=Paludisphaera soli TaxID=2712865 RepID=UPI0013E9A84F|nr:hypothetical protein [Paludisphaera soli]
MMNLQDCSITAILNFGVDPRTMKPWFEFAALDQLLTVSFNGVVHMRFSRDWDDRFSDDSDVLEVQSESRKPSEDDLQGYDYSVEDLKAFPELQIITIFGALHVKIICESFETRSEPLAIKYPYII